MSKTPSDKYLHFTVSLLKGSAALDALQEDALKHHMLDHPGQLIALRLTEYYEMMNKGIVQPVIRIPAVTIPFEPPADEEATAKAAVSPSAPSPVVPPPQAAPAVPTTPVAPAPLSRPRLPTETEAGPGITQTAHMRALQAQQQQQRQSGAVDVVFAPSAADQNADEAADYWTAL